MSIKLSLPVFDGTKGPVQAAQFIDSMTAIFHANDVNDARQPYLAQAAFTPDSAAAIWLANEKLCDAANFATWTLMQAKIRAEFCRPLTLAQNQLEKKKLVLRQDETASQFYNRVRFYMNTRDFALTPNQRAADGYILQYNTRVKETFVEGLSQTLLNKLAAVDISATTPAELVAAVTQAQSLLLANPNQVNAISNNQRGRGRGRGRGGNQQQQQYQPQQQQYQQQPRPGGGGGGRGYNNNAGARRPGPSSQDLAQRQKAQCGRCMQWVKHRRAECWVELKPDGTPVRPVRRNVNAITNEQQFQAEFPPPQQATQSAYHTPSAYADPLNPHMG